MQQSSYIENIDPRLHIYPSREADQVKQELLESHDRQALEAIGRLLLEKLDLTSVVPVLVLRGGLMLWQPYREVAGTGPTGIIVPKRDQHEESPRIAYASIPHVPGSHYLLLDILVASGRTMGVCLSEFYQHFQGQRIDIAAPFVSSHARNYIISNFNSTHIHCIWHAEQIDHRGWMIGPGFDIGDYTLGWMGDYVNWPAGGTAHA